MYTLTLINFDAIYGEGGVDLDPHGTLTPMYAKCATLRHVGIDRDIPHALATAGGDEMGGEICQRKRRFLIVLWQVAAQHKPI